MNSTTLRLARLALWTSLAGAAVLLVLLLLIVPLVLPYFLGRAATRQLGHPVSVERVIFNPFTFRLSLYGLSIRDNGPGQAELAGFNAFWAQVDPVRLAHKRLRVPTVGFEGLRIDAVLLPGNRINLLSLAPAPSTATPTAVPASSTAAAPLALPEVEVDSFVLRNASISFTDQSIGQGYTLRFAPLDLSVTGFSTQAGAQVSASLKSAVDGQGSLNLDALIRSPMDHPAVEATLSLSQYAAQAIGPYVGRYTGRSVKGGGRIDFNATYRVSNGKLDAQHRLIIQDFNLGKKVPSKDALHLPFSLVLSLLKDRHGRIDISLPVTGDLNDPKFRYWGALCRVLLNFLEKLATAPFTAISKLAPGGGKGPEAQDIGSAFFPVGSAVLSTGELEKLGRIAAALRARPALFMEVNGTYDPREDGLALQKQGLAQLVDAERAKKDGTDPEIYERLITARMGDEALANVRKQAGGAQGPDYPELLKARLLDSLSVKKEDMEAIATARAQAVLQALAADGAAASQVKAGSIHDSVAAVGKVPSDFTLGR